MVHVVATIIHQARRREDGDGSVTLTFTPEAAARLTRTLDRLYGKK